MPPGFLPVPFIPSTSIFQMPAKVSLGPPSPCDLETVTSLASSPALKATSSAWLLLGLSSHTHAPGYLQWLLSLLESSFPRCPLLTASFPKIFHFSWRPLTTVSKIQHPLPRNVSCLPSQLHISLTFVMQRYITHFCAYCFLTISSARKGNFV